MKIEREPFGVETSRGRVSAELERGGSSRGRLLICAHGAGGHMADRGVMALAEALVGGGFDVVRFNFLYKERGSARPDAMPLLREVYEAVVVESTKRFLPEQLVLSGRSMGGRVATMLGADGFACDGVMPVAYPLHPPGQPEKLRVEHLRQIAVPVLCFSGTRDEFCTPELMERAVGGLPNWTQHWLEGADHSLHVLKRSGRTDAQVLEELTAAAAAWAEGLAPRA